MRLIIVIIIGSFLLISCKKEGLSETTGNLEVLYDISGANLRSYKEYKIFSEENYNRFRDFKPYDIYIQKSLGKGNIIEKGIHEGQYYIIISIDNNWEIRKGFYITARKTNTVSVN